MYEVITSVILDIILMTFSIHAMQLKRYNGHFEINKTFFTYINNSLHNI